MTEIGNEAARHVAATTNVSLPLTVVLGASVQTVGTGPHATKVIVLQFSAALNPADAESLISYSLVTLPRTKKPKPKRVALAQATYNPAAFNVTLMTREPLELNPPIQLTVEADRVFDASGKRPLNGGENFVTVLE